MENECEMSVDDLRRLCLPGVVQWNAEREWNGQESAEDLPRASSSVVRLRSQSLGRGTGWSVVRYDGSPPTSLRGASLSCDSGRSSEDSNRRVRFH